MLTRWVTAFVGLAVLVPGVARADKTTDQVLAAVPAEAIAFVCVPNLQQLDSDVQAAITNLGLAPLINPPGMASPIGLLEQFLGMSDGLDTSGSLILAVLPPATPGVLEPRTALIVPATDPKALLTAMGATPGEGGQWTLSIQEKPLFAIAGDGRIVLSDSAETAKAVAEGKTGIADSVPQADRDAMVGLDLTIWIDATKLIKTFREPIDGFIAIFGMMQAAGPFGSAANGENPLELLVDGAKSLMLGVSLEDGGVGLRFVLGVNPGTKMAEQLKIETTTSPLLNGLPPDSYMLAFGQTINPAAMKASIGNMDPMFKAMGQAGQLNEEQVGTLTDLFKEWFGSLTGLRGVVSALSAGPDGIIGLCLLMDTGDSAKSLTQLGEAMKAIGEMATEDSEAKQVIEALTHDPEAEDIDGTTVQHVKFDLAKMDDVDEEDLEEITPIIGQDGLLLRIAAADDDTVAIAFGGGSDYMQLVIQHAKNDKPMLDSDPGILRVADHVPSDRAYATYIAVDRIINCIGTGAKALDDEEFPVHMAELNAPIAIVGSGGDGWVRADIYLPTELIDAAKNAIMGILASQMGGPGPEGNLVGSRNSNVFHYPDCGFAENINPENLVYFESALEARRVGRRPCESCKPE